MDKIIKLESVDLYNSLYGLETLHPLVTVADLRKATKTLNHVQLDYGLYAVFLKLYKSCDIKYGRKSYDYQDGTIVCFAPGQSIYTRNLNDDISQPVLGPVVPSGPDPGNRPREKHKELHLFFLCRKRGVAHLGTGKGDYHRLF